jgi:peroxiredoxin
MEIGQTIPQIILPAIDGSQFDNYSLKGKGYLLTFFRFATCPFCNMRMAQLVQTKPKLGDDFEIVAIFESEIDHLKKHANKHLAKFPILADYERQYYKLFGVKKSVLGMLKGMLFRMPTALKAMFLGYLPHEISSRLFIMPLSILVDKEGVIQNIYYGKDEGDHIPLEQVVEFSTKD